MKVIFSGPTHVDIQGERVLIFENTNQPVTKVVEYSLIGIKKVKIFDFRNFGLEAINSLLETNQLKDFAPKFNHPANATITQSPEGEINIKLNNTSEVNPTYMLWIAIGINEKIIPKYDYCIKEILPLKNKKKKISLLSLYKRPHPNEYPYYYLSSDT